LDEVRQKNLEDLGLIVIRFTNEDVRNKIKNVLEKINEFIKAKCIIRERKYSTQKIKFKTKFPLQGDRGYESDCRL
jgi:uncharacterized protein DUF559